MTRKIQGTRAGYIFRPDYEPHWFDQVRDATFLSIQSGACVECPWKVVIL